MNFRNTSIKNGVLVLIIVLFSGAAVFAAGPKKSSAGAYLDSKGVWQETKEQKDSRMQWWREAKFGMFIHWGVYAVAAGEWKGQSKKGPGEWIQQKYEIPVKEYEQLAKDFNPVKYNAEQWVKIAKEAGMKYIVITAKHHDGFAMFKSKASQFNIVDSTPFKRDPLKELAAACKKEGIKLGFYYSHNLDWHEPDATMNYWDFKDNIDKSQAADVKNSTMKKFWWRRTTFGDYMKRKGLPQMEELLSNYGDVAVIWYDGAWSIQREYAVQYANVVRRLQPDCIVSGRVYEIEKELMGDFVTTGDNSIPTNLVTGDWEIPGTMNNTWGYRSDDNKWKSTEMLVQNLVDVVSKGGNYLLNVGPTAEGVIPQESITRLKEVGAWMDKNSESIYGADPSPFGRLVWGRCTAKPGKLYLHVFDWPKDGKLEFATFENKIKKVYLLAGEKKADLFHMKLGRNIVITVPSQPLDEIDTVIVVEIEGQIKAQPQEKKAEMKSKV